MSLKSIFITLWTVHKLLNLSCLHANMFSSTCTSTNTGSCLPIGDHVTMISEGFLKTRSICQSCQIMVYNINICTDNYEINSKFFWVFFNGPEIRHCNHGKWILNWDCITSYHCWHNTIILLSHDNLIFGGLGTIDVCLGWFGVFQWTPNILLWFSLTCKTHDLLPVNLGHRIFKLIFLKDARIFKLIFLKDAKQTGK